MGALTRVWWRGERFNKQTVAAIKEVERRLGKTAVIFQGGWEEVTDYSGSTHAGGDVVDLWFPGIDGYTQERVMRKVGFDAWYRYPAVGFDTIHIHAILHPGKVASADAKSQHVNHHDRGDGLWPLVHGDDPSPNKPCDTRFDYDAWRKLQRLNGSIGDLTERIGSLRTQIKRLLKIRTSKDRERDKIKQSLQH